MHYLRLKISAFQPHLCPDVNIFITAGYQDAALDSDLMSDNNNEDSSHQKSKYDAYNLEEFRNVSIYLKILKLCEGC